MFSSNNWIPSLTIEVSFPLQIIVEMAYRSYRPIVLGKILCFSRKPVQWKSDTCFSELDDLQVWNNMNSLHEQAAITFFLHQSWNSFCQQSYLSFKMLHALQHAAVLPSIQLGAPSYHKLEQLTSSFDALLLLLLLWQFFNLQWLMLSLLYYSCSSM